MKKEPITITFGALCEPLKHQLKEQRLKIKGRANTRFFSDQHQVIIDAYMFQLVTDQQYLQMRNRFMKKLIPYLEPLIK